MSVSDERLADLIERYEAGHDWSDAEHWEALVVLRAEQQRRAYAKANPLGGPASMFRAIAERIEAGEEYWAVLRDYGVSLGNPSGQATTEASENFPAEASGPVGLPTRTVPVEPTELLRRLMEMLREEAPHDDPMAPFAYDARWEALAREVDAFLAAPPQPQGEAPPQGSGSLRGGRT